MSDASEMWWQSLVENKFRTRSVEAPYPVLQAKVEAARDALAEAMEAKLWEQADLSDVQAQTWAKATGQHLSVLERTPMTIKMLSETRVGHVLKRCRKEPPEKREVTVQVA